MDELERQLKNALKREEPPAWFEAKVLAAAATEPARRSWFERLFHGYRLRWATAVAAAGLVVSGVVWRVEERREQAAGEEAKARLVLALKITGSKLRKIEQKVNEINRVN